MGALLCCLRIPDDEEEHNNGSGTRVFHYQSPLNGNFLRKCKELLRSPIRDQPISSSQETEPISNCGINPLQTLNVLPPKSQTIDGGYSRNLSEDEDVCPTCLEDYNDQNPRIPLQCGHEFHLGCIYEWMERSEACPFCGKMMLFVET